MVTRDFKMFLFGALSVAAAGYAWMLYSILVMRLDRIEGFLSSAFGGQ